ncbi:hypothetical protein TNIN_370341 [Trichonephila inaurata madagascariensis]|uniref:Uncharacterized protein n=1 Tax=Trichonephila inaurata madagascariensis TaxID=2747483 RepID=A0A8X6YN10_9ARAC|nr:hypothetical protein TNIN_370341 [Trichonephila inaurata madagascariensis]
MESSPQVSSRLKNIRKEIIGYKRKKFRREEAATSELDIERYNLRSGIKEAAESRPSRGQMLDQGTGPEEEDTRNTALQQRSKIQEAVQKPKLSGT